MPFLYLVEKLDFCGGGLGEGGGTKGVPENDSGLGGSCGNIGSTYCGKVENRNFINLIT